MIPSDSEGLLFYRAADFHRLSLTQSVIMNDRETNAKKAKDWDVLELFYKMDRVEGPKVHAWKLRQGAGVICGEDRLMLH